MCDDELSCCKNFDCRYENLLKSHKPCSFPFCDDFQTQNHPFCIGSSPSLGRMHIGNTPKFATKTKLHYKGQKLFIPFRSFYAGEAEIIEKNGRRMCFYFCEWIIYGHFPSNSFCFFRRVHWTLRPTPFANIRLPTITSRRGFLQNCRNH